LTIPRRFSQDVAIYFGPRYNSKKPFVTLTWLMPDGRQFDLGSFSIVSNQTFIASQNLPGKYLGDSGLRASDGSR